MFRSFQWGESAVPHLLAIQWFAEKQQMAVNAPAIESVISTLCERNNMRSEDESFPPPLASADDVLAKLFSSDSTKKPNRRAPGTWSLEALMEFLARRNQRMILERLWRQISRLDMLSFQPEPAIDGFLWKSPKGHEAVRHPETTQSWKVMVDKASEDRRQSLPQMLRDDSDFAIMFLLAYPHRLSPALVRHLDARLQDH
ncbi:MAG TPA: hypothetical protein VH207_02230 [Chthoniobacterales bacterium]|nr:hypothetical protein [Chthoniobacterales bacterium]